MANLWKRQGAQHHRRNGQERSEGSGNSGRLIDHAQYDRFAESLEHLADVAEAQHRRSRSFTVTHTTSILTPGSILPDLHLPEESAIASVYVENSSATATLVITEGSGAGGRTISRCLSKTWTSAAIADHISSISVESDVADQALVIVTLSTKNWTPAHGSL